MPVDLLISDKDITIITGKSGSQSQLLLDDVAVILTAALQAGVTPTQLINAFGEVTPRDAPVTRMIVNALANTYQQAHGEYHKST